MTYQEWIYGKVFNNAMYTFRTVNFYFHDDAPMQTAVSSTYPGLTLPEALRMMAAWVDAHSDIYVDDCFDGVLEISTDDSQTSAQILLDTEVEHGVW